MASHVSPIDDSSADPHQWDHLALKVQLSRPALDRLIGDDAAMELILTHAAVREVVSRHMDVVKKTVEANIEDYVKGAVEAAFGRMVKPDPWNKGSGGYQPSSAVIQAVEQTVQPMVGKFAENYVMSKTGEIQKIVREVLDSSIERLITTTVIKRVQAVIEAAAGEAISMPPPGK